MAIVKLSRKFHKWLMLFVGVQMLIWAATGTYMVVMNIDYIHGDTLILAKNKANEINGSQIKFSLIELKQQFPLAKNIQLKMLQKQAVYQFVDDKNKRLVSAETGAALAAINKEQAKSIALNRYTGSGDIVGTTLLTQTNGEISPRILPAWRIEFDDMAAPRLYISAQTGELVTKRHSFWVLFDWMFRFHIMDYSDDEDATNILLLVIAIISLLACLTGIVLTYVSFIKVRGKSIQTPKNKSALRFMPWVRYFHRWLSLLVFIQLIIWLGTGLYFNLMDHQKASGNQNRQRIVESMQSVNFDTLLPLTQVVQQYPKAITVSLISRLNQPLYLVTLEQGLYQHFVRKQLLLDAKTGERSDTNNTFFEQLAQLSFSGQAPTRSSMKLTPPIEELPKLQNSVWQINFADALNTSVYVDAQNASVIAHVDDDKRLGDLMFTLHFIDYPFLNRIFKGKNGSFNNLQIILLALLTLLFSLTGVYWLVHLLKHKQIRWK